MFDILMIVLIGLLLVNLLLSHFFNRRLQSRVVACEKLLFEQNAASQKQQQNIANLYERTTPKPLSQEQQEFKNDLEVKWAALFADMQTKIEEKLQADEVDIGSHLQQWKLDFMNKLNEEYKKACDSIAFHTVQYKKTITKKRKETSRKTPAQQPKKYRSIDDE